MRPHVVIIGGGFGGLMVARKLRNAPVRVTVVDRRNHHLFQPLLYQVATAGLSPTNIAMPIRSILRHHENTEVFMAEVTGIDTKSQKVIMGDRQISYDYLIIATGSWHSYFGHNEWQDFAPGLKTVKDATYIRQKILLSFELAEIEPDLERKKALLTFLLVGAGPTGVEMAGSIAELAYQALRSDFRHLNPAMIRIILVEAGPQILGSFPESLAAKARRKLEALRVEVLVGARVESMDAHGATVAGKKILSENMIWCAGVLASPAGKWLNAEMDRTGRVKVGPDLSLPGHPDLFVIGDTAHFIQDDKPLPGVAPVAMQEGHYVAEVIKRKVLGKSPLPGFVYIDKGNLATVGRSFAIVDIGKLKLSGMIAWLVWLVVHIYYLIGFRNRALIIVEWAWAYITFQRGSRLIAGDVSKGTAKPELA